MLQPGSQSSFAFGRIQGFSYERVEMTQGVLCISPGVTLDKTPSTSKKKFCIGRLTSSILNLLKVMLSELQKSLISIDSFKKVMARKDSKEQWQKTMTRKDDDFSPHAFVSLRTRFSTHSSYRYICVPAGRTLRLGIYLRSSTCQGVIPDCRST